LIGGTSSHDAKWSAALAAKLVLYGIDVKLDDVYKMAYHVHTVCIE
jgi:hypothetical protein